MQDETNQAALIGQIIARREDLGFLARLRRGLSPDTEDQAWPIIASRMKRDDFNDEEIRKVWLTVGGLSAILVHADMLVSNRKSLGRILREIYEIKNDNHKSAKGKNNDDDLIKSSSARRLARILNSREVTSACPIVVDVVKMAIAAKISVDVYRLYDDLIGWRDAEKREQIRLLWSQDFYRTVPISGDGSEEAADE